MTIEPLSGEEKALLKDGWEPKGFGMPRGLCRTYGSNGIPSGLLERHYRRVSPEGVLGYLSFKAGRLSEEEMGNLPVYDTKGHILGGTYGEWKKENGVNG